MEFMNGVHLRVQVSSVCEYTMNIYEYANLSQPRPAIIIWFCGSVVVGRCMIPLPVAGGSAQSLLPLVMMMASMTPLAVSHHKLTLRQR